MGDKPAEDATAGDGGYPIEGMCPRAEAEAVDAMAATTKVVGGRVLVWYREGSRRWHPEYGASSSVHPLVVMVVAVAADS